MGNRSRKYFQSFRSHLEGVFSDHLRTREKQYGYKCKYEAIKIPYLLEGKYTPDFLLVWPDGYQRIIEAKGYLDNDARRKMVAVKVANPELDIRIVFEKDNLMRKGSKAKYSDWATKVGYPWAIGSIPNEWLER